MTVRREEPKSMRHSSSWPDRAAQTVKVRVDPLSRAFTIIPTIRETLHPLLATGNTGWIDEIVLLDHGHPSSVRTKRRFANETKLTQRDIELGETFELRPLVPDVMNENFIKINDNRESNNVDNKGESKLLGSNEMVNDQIEDPSEKNESNLRIVDEEQGSKNERTDTNQMDSELKSVEKIQMQEDFKKDNEDPLPFETIVKIEPPKRSQNVFQEKEATGSSYQSTPKRATTPYIQIVDYDYITASTAAENMQHACPKCTSEGLLQQRVDPFRSPVSSKKNNVVRGGRCQGKPETLRKYSATEAKMRSSWRRIGASGLIGARNKEREKYGRKRNGSPLCRPMSDARKEATLRRHYYPEGGWGYVIVTCSALVHFLGIGLQLAAPGSWHLTAELKFHQPALHSAGKIETRPCSLIGRCLIEPDVVVYLNRKSSSG